MGAVGSADGEAVHLRRSGYGTLVYSDEPPGPPAVACGTVVRSHYK